MESGPADSKLFCLHCGYNLTGLPSGQCPECGTAFDLATLPTLMAQRRRGVFRSFWWLGLPPGLYVALLALAYLLLLPVGRSKAADAFMYVGGFGGLFLLFMAAVTSILVGRRLARRLARRYPADPPNTASIAMTLLFGGIFFAAQIVTMFCCFFGMCICLVPLNIH